jgi:glycosyltransferase involved in cell wall biosynthesis
VRLLIVAKAFAPNVGGAEGAVMTLARGLVERHKGIDTMVVTETGADGYDDHALPFRVVRRPSVRQMVRLLCWADVVHLAGPRLGILILALVLRRQVVVEHHGCQVVCPNGELFYRPTQRPCTGHFMARRYYECIRCNATAGWRRSVRDLILTFPRRWLCYAVARNVTLSDWLNWMLRLPRAITIYYGVDIPEGIPERSRPEMSGRVAFVGRLVGSKGARTLLEAVDRLRERSIAVSVEVVGDGPERGALEAQVADYKLSEQVRFRGVLAPAEVRRVLQSVDAVVMPSLYEESFGLVCAEGMASGCVPVVSEVGTLREVVGTTGLKFKPGDVDGLVECLKRICGDQDLVRMLGMEAWRRVRSTFTVDHMIDEHIALYRDVVGGHAAARARID